MFQETWNVNKEPLIGYYEYSNFASRTSAFGRASGLSTYVSLNLDIKHYEIEFQLAWLLCIKID